MRVVLSGLALAQKQYKGEEQMNLNNDEPQNPRAKINEWNVVHEEKEKGLKPSHCCPLPCYKIFEVWLKEDFPTFSLISLLWTSTITMSLLEHESKFVLHALWTGTSNAVISQASLFSAAAAGDGRI